MPQSFYGSEHDGAPSTAPRAVPHHRAAAAAVLPALAARALRVAPPAAMSGRGGFGPKLPAERTWVPLSERSLVLWEAPHVTRPRSAGQALGASSQHPLQRHFLAIEYCTVDLMSESVSPSNQGDPTSSV